MGELLFPGILYGAPLDEETLGLRSGSIHVWREADLKTTHVWFGRHEGEDRKCVGIDLARITHEVPVESEEPPGVAMLIDYGEGRTYSVGNDVCWNSHERLVYCLDHILHECADSISEWMDADPVELPED